MNNNKKTMIYALVIVVVLFLLWKMISSSSTEVKKVSFDIKKDKIEIKIGDTETIEYDLNTEANIRWESSNTDVVTVNNGKITGVGLGNAVIKGKVNVGNDTLVDNVFVTTYYGNKSLALNDIIIDDKELFITKGDSFKLPIVYNPQDAYITSIDYSVEDKNIVSFDGTIYARELGSTNVYVTINKSIYKGITVNVIDKPIVPTFSNKVKNIEVDEEIITLKPGETRDIEYTVNPQDAFIESVEWDSSNSSVAYVEDGTIIAKSSGNAIIELTINKSIHKEINVIVSIPVKSITLNSSKNLQLKVGDSKTIKIEISPSNASNKKILYTSSSSAVRVDENGIVTALASGSGVITAKTEDGGYSTNITFMVNPRKGYIEGDGGIWGYSSSTDVNPVRADINFFRNLVSKGKGTLSGNIYSYTDSKRSYKYDIAQGILKAGDRNYLMRFYYPPGVDLSTVNTFTFFGGVGERSFGGYFSVLNRDTSQMKSSGIIILMSTKEYHDYRGGIYATEFVNSIVDQKESAKNTIGGYSMGGPAAGDAANEGPYSRLIIVDSYFEKVDTSTKLKNFDIVFFSPVGDSMVNNTIPALNKIVKANYTNVTIVTNNSNLNTYSSSFLVINPGSKMGKGHGYSNITTAKLFSYACS